MKQCKHNNLVLLPNTTKRLRCRHCHLTIKSDELDGNYCPECLESRGRRHADFETVEAEESTRYRCEECHIIIEYVVP